MFHRVPDQVASHTVLLLAALAHPRRRQRLDVGHRLPHCFPERSLNAGIAAFQGHGDALGAVQVHVPGRDAMFDQLGRELLAGVRIEAVDEALELLVVRGTGQAEGGGALAAPLAAEVVGLEVIAAVGLRVVGLGGLGVCDGLDAEHKRQSRYALPNCTREIRKSKVAMKLQTDALRRAEGEWNRSSGTGQPKDCFLADWEGEESQFGQGLAPATKQACGHACLSSGLQDSLQALRLEILLAGLLADMPAACLAALLRCHHAAMLAPK